MSKPLENLAKIGSLKIEPCNAVEFKGLVQSGRVRLQDAQNATLSIESKFDLAYNASHALALAALRWHGYRSESRYLVFQCLAHTLGLQPAEYRVFDLCHRRRNVAEYEGHLEVEEALVMALLTSTQKILELIDQLDPVPSTQKQQ